MHIYWFLKSKILLYSLCVLVVLSIILYIQIEQISNYDIGISVSDFNTEKGNLRSHKSLNQTITLDDIFISVKTTNDFLRVRVEKIINTWFELAPNQTWFFTDAFNLKYHKLLDGHLINTHCPSHYLHNALCCKMSVEFDTYLKSKKKWFCHFDDDNYVNVVQLVKILQKYNPLNDWYLGKKSVQMSLKLRDKPKSPINSKQFWFATGGAGFCISKALTLKMAPLISGGKFMKRCAFISSPDDVTIGYIIDRYFAVSLTEIKEFHSHLEDLAALPFEDLKNQISFSYDQMKDNVVKIKGFTLERDPSRFMSLHCYLFPKSTKCS